MSSDAAVWVSLSQASAALPLGNAVSHWQSSEVIHVSWRQGDAERFPDLLPGYSYATRQKPHDFNLCESNSNSSSILFLISAALLKEDRGPVSSHEEDFNLYSRSSPLGESFVPSVLSL